MIIIEIDFSSRRELDTSNVLDKMNKLQNKSILIVGGDSSIGVSLVAAFEVDNKQIWRTTRHRNKVNDRCLFLDLSDDMNYWLLPPVKTVIFCAAVTSQEYCRVNPEFSWRVNVSGTVTLATRMIEAGIFVIFLSSNAVFNGEISLAKSTDSVTPQTEYGRQKVATENQLLKFEDKVAIVRFSKVITPEMSLIDGWIQNLNYGSVIHPFCDMVIAPVPIKFAVLVLREVAVRQVRGIIQVSTKRDITYADLAHYIALKLGSDQKLVQPISYRNIGLTYAQRNTSLDSSRLSELGMLLPDIWKGVDETFRLR